MPTTTPVTASAPNDRPLRALRGRLENLVTWRFWGALGALSGIFAGCDGQGGASTPRGRASTSVDFPVKQAIRALYARGDKRSFTLEGEFHGENGTVELLRGHLKARTAPFAPAIFEGATAQQRVRKLHGSITGVKSPHTIEVNVATSDYFDPDFDFLGLVRARRYCIPTQPSRYPLSARPGQQGTIAELKCYKDGTKSKPDGFARIVYSTHAVGSSMMDFSEARGYFNNHGQITLMEVYGYRIGADGHIELRGFGLQIPSKSSRPYSVRVAGELDEAGTSPPAASGPRYWIRPDSARPKLGTERVK